CSVVDGTAEFDPKPTPRGRGEDQVSVRARRGDRVMLGPRRAKYHSYRREVGPRASRRRILEAPVPAKLRAPSRLLFALKGETDVRPRNSPSVGRCRRRSFFETTSPPICATRDPRLTDRLHQLS